MTATSTQLLCSIPERITNGEVLNLLQNTEIDWKYVQLTKEFTDLNDDVLSEWLNVSVKTFRSYKKKDSELKENLKEQVVLLISLFKHGYEVFEKESFHQWLESENFFLSGKMPFSYLNTVSGIRYIDDRLTALEYGDNV